MGDLQRLILDRSRDHPTRGDDERLIPNSDHSQTLEPNTRTPKTKRQKHRHPHRRHDERHDGDLVREGVHELQIENTAGRELESERRPHLRPKRMTDFYAVEEEEDHLCSVRSLFKAHRQQTVQKRRKEEKASAETQTRFALYETDQTLGFTTQNVNGLGATSEDREHWYSAFGTTDDHGRTDVMLIQETHVEDNEVDWFRRKYAGRWGFRSEAGQEALSHWAPAMDRRGGVAILINPNGSFCTAVPVLQHCWSPHFMAIRGTLAGKSTTICNIYAPHKPADRERFYKSLQDVEFDTGDMVLVGGDFNSTLDAVADRSYVSSSHGHDSPQLRDLLARWGLLDPVAIARPSKWTDEGLRKHHRETHTYTYTAPGPVEATSRLDRCSTRGQCGPSRGQTTREVPEDPVRVQRPARIHPVPDYAVTATKALTNQLLADFWRKLQDSNLEAAATQLQWDDLKKEIARRTRICVRERRRTRRNTLKQKLGRLVRQQQRHVEAQEDGPSRAARLRRAITECQTAKATAGKKRLFREATHRTAKTTKALFKRISTKFGDNVVHRLDPIPGAPPRPVHAKADILADAWQPILQQAATAEESVRHVVAWNENVDPPSTDQAAIDNAFTEDEVRTALKACKPDKAAGPDLLGNGWYREYEAALVPILTKLFNCWYDNGIFPSTFLEADIFCLKKGGVQSDALNFRPLALLNTDYKIFTRILASRVGITLPEQIHPNQNGFVPGRTIYETLDIYDAAQKMVIADPSQNEATALLLDFKKAYDSLDRGYILAVLRRKGYPEKFIRVIAAIHAGTQVRFLANGAKSRAIAVTSGIRQGCPLAPLLFIIALDPLYRKLDGFLGAKGIVIQSAAGQFELRVAGYADDTAAFVKNPADIPQLLQTLQIFGNASGLQINTGKTVVIALHPNGPRAGMELPPTLQYQDAHTACRYLGIQVGSNIVCDASWTLAAKQIQVQLLLACRKVLTVDQRSIVAGAIIVPKLLYIARHEWPSKTEVDAMDKRIRNYVWHGQFADEIEASRAWLDADLATLPRTDGGLAVPDIRSELYAMAAVVVGRWAKLGTKPMHIVGDVLFAPATGGIAPEIYVTPEYVLPSPNGIPRKSTMWLTGLHVIAQTGRQESETTDDDRAIVMENFKTGQPATEWEGAVLHVNYNTKGVTTGRRPKPQAGVFHQEWLQYVNINIHRIFDEDGTTTTLPAASEYTRSTWTYLRDVLSWTRHSKWTLDFTFNAEFRTEADRITEVRFALALLTNHAHIILRPDFPCEITITAHPEDHPVVAELHTEEQSILRIHPTVTGRAQELRVHNHGALLNGLRRYMQPGLLVTEVHPHPDLSRLVCLWAGKCRWSRTRRHYKQRVAAAKIQRGERSLNARSQSWAILNSKTSHGLGKLEWKRIRRVIGMGPWGEQILIRLKLHAFSTSDRRQNRHGCPHAACRHKLGVTLQHIFWDCGAATQLRRHFLNPWRKLGLAGTAIEQNIFGLHLPSLPPGIWKIADDLLPVTMVMDQALTTAITQLVEGCWRLGAAINLHAVWRWRVSHFDDLNDVTKSYHIYMLGHKLRQGYSTVHLHMKADWTPEVGNMAAHILTRALHSSTYEPTANEWSGTLAVKNSGHFLFFAGRVAGPKGAAGSGAAILWLDPATGKPTLRWMGHMSFATSKVTLDMAARLGLLMGIKACATKGYGQLQIIGDNAIIIGQHRQRKPPKTEQLRALH